jgi:hypothetical protein
MKAIAATILNGRRDLFWLDPGLSMTAVSPAEGFGFNLHHGGIFTSVPAVVASMAIQPGETHQGGLLEPGTALAGPGHGGGVGGIIQRTPRLDVFGLGGDYAMYHKALWGPHDQSDFAPWYRLGGVFTSAPAAIALAGDRVDVFGLGLDHALYTKTRLGDGWSPEWQRLGGTYTSAPSPLVKGPKQFDLFIREADFTLRRLQSDGATWHSEQNLGGSLASPPVVVSWAADRVDIFAVFHDQALWHRWWDGELWNDWESLGGRYTGEPAAATWEPGRLDVFVVGADDHLLYQHWFSNQTWSDPRAIDDQEVVGSATVVSSAPNRLEVFTPGVGDLRRRIWDGSSWENHSGGAAVRVPSRYRFSVDLVRARTIRALNSDTDAAATSLAVGNMPIQTRTQWIGTIGGFLHPGESQTNLLEFNAVTVDLAEAVSFNYLVVNNGHAPQAKILAALASAADSLSLASVSSTTEDIAKAVVKFALVKLTEALSIPVVGSVLKPIESWLLDKLSEAIFESCDGVVAAEAPVVMMGRDLFIATNNGKNALTGTTTHKGTPSPTTCGGESSYEVTWTVKPL